MNLTRKEWEEMWVSLRIIQIQAQYLRIDKREKIINEINKIKERIQSVIGQME